MSRLTGLAIPIAIGTALASAAIAFQTLAALDNALSREMTALLLGLSAGGIAIVLLVQVVMQREIVRRKSAEQSLRDLNAELENRVAERTAELERRRSFTEAVLDNMRDAMLVSHETHIVYANQACADLLGAATPAELLKHTTIDLVPPQDRDELRRTVRSRLATDAAIPLIERRALRLDGRQIEVESTIAPFRQGEQRHNAVILRDVTARKAMEAQIAQRTREAESWARFIEAVQATMRDAMVVIRGEVIAHANGAFARLVGAARARDLVGRPIMDFIPEAEAAMVANLTALILEGSAVPTALEGTLRRLDGSAAEIETTVGQFFDRGEMVVVLILRDISDRKLAEQRQRHGQKMEALGHLTGGIAHDFNNLLAVTICNLDLAMDLAGDNQELRSLLNSAVSGAMRGSQLTQRLLAFSRKTALEPVVVDLNAQVAGLREMLSRTLGHSVTVETSLVDAPWRTLVDPSQLEDAIVNLAINARDGMAGDGKMAGGTLTIETANVRLDEEAAAARDHARAGDYVMVAVRDTGAGIPAEILDKVLDPFFTTKAVGQGSGLGLSMVYGFVRQSGGHLRILSEPGKGTSVQLFLPRTLNELAAPAPPDVATHSDSQGERILLVEDNPALLAAARTQLSGLGYRVRTAANGVTALQILTGGEPFDLLLSDVVMPGGVSGFELAAEARRRQPDLRVLLMSGHADDAIGGHDPSLRVLAKPYRRRELAEAIRDALAGIAEVAAK